jgi:membrane-associated protease RseP (regulator of RpoE activity)
MIVTWHEFGHMALARKLGIRIDSVGVGAYFVMPALFTNVSLIALLTPIERISVMLGGVYFQAILGTALAVWQLLVPNSVLPWLIQSNALIAALNLIPFIRLDGHHVANELIGILKRRGTHLRVRQAYVILNHAANGLFAIYLIYVWRASYFEALARPTAMAVVYFLFVTLVCTVLIYKNLKMLVGVLGRMGNRTN